MDQRVAEREPHIVSALYVAGFIGTLVITVGTFVLGYTTKDAELSDFLTKLLGPFFGLVSAGWTADYYHRRDANKNIERDVGKAVYSARILLQGEHSVDQRLAEASNALNEGDLAAGLRAVEQALARTDGNLLHVTQTIREWESLSHSAAAEGVANFEADFTSIRARREQIPLGDSGQQQQQGGEHASS
jgi:hypothetical protein